MSIYIKMQLYGVIYHFKIHIIPRDLVQGHMALYYSLQASNSAKS